MKTYLKFGTVAVVGAMVLTCGITAFAKLKGTPGAKEDYFINVPVQMQAEGQCNRYAIGAVIAAATHYDKSYTLSQACSKKVMVPDMASTLNLVDIKVRQGLGRWVLEKNFDTASSNETLVNIQNSIKYERPVLIGNGLYRKDSDPNRPGHFYLVIGYYKLNDIYRLYLRDGHKQDSRDFQINVGGKMVNPTVKNLQDLGENNKIDLDGSRGHAVMLYFKPAAGGISV